MSYPPSDQWLGPTSPTGWKMLDVYVPFWDGRDQLRRSLLRLWQGGIMALGWHPPSCLPLLSGCFSQKHGPNWAEDAVFGGTWCRRWSFHPNYMVGIMSSKVLLHCVGKHVSQNDWLRVLENSLRNHANTTAAVTHFPLFPSFHSLLEWSPPPRTCPGQGKASTIIFPAELTSAKPLKVTASTNPKLFHT